MPNSDRPIHTDPPRKPMNSSSATRPVSNMTRSLCSDCGGLRVFRRNRIQVPEFRDLALQQADQAGDQIQAELQPAQQEHELRDRQGGPDDRRRCEATVD